jgi:signal transduction histidine kinase
MSDAVLTPRGWFRRGLSCLGIVVIVWAAVAAYLRHDVPLWVLVVLMVAELAWLVLAFLSSRFVKSGLVCVSVMVVAGALVAAPLQGVGIVPVAVAILWLARDLRRSLVWPIVLGLIGMVVVLIGNVLQPVAPLGALAIEGAIILAFLSGQNRRQFLIADLQSRQLLEEQSRTDVLAARQQIAGDIHDVLAHSLGGLVIQLDAVDALLDAGETDAAAARVRDARALAAEGLAEARRAVSALSAGADESPVVVPAEQLLDDLNALLDAHRSLGGTVSFAETGARRDVSGALAVALRRALQEGLTNARKHAPGASVTARLTWASADVTLELDNPLREAPVADRAGGGHGLVGMRERFAALPGGTATAAVAGDRFVVKVTGATA